MLAINRWTLAEWYDGPSPILKATGSYLNHGNIRLLSFEDMEEAYKIHMLRTRHGKSMQYLQKAFVDLRKETKSDHPLLHCEIVVFDYLALVKPATKTHPRKGIPLGTDAQVSLYIPDVLDTWAHRIVADSEGRGKQIFPWRDAKTDDFSRPVSINANVLSGNLVITGTRVPVSVLKGYRESGKSIEEIAELYSLDVDTVRKALYHIEPEQKAS